ncbi:MAG TPA: hypothetical protein EYG74_05870 [Sulfurimonas autotrophica]|nr:hypothetical protein [Sulfurimonas autotrophica]
MMRIKQITVIACALTIMGTSVQADVSDTIEAVAKHAITAAKEVAMADTTEVEMSNVDMQAVVSMEDSAALGNLGNTVKADKVKMNNVVMKSKVEMKRSVIVGSAGNAVGAL